MELGAHLGRYFGEPNLGTEVLGGWKRRERFALPIAPLLLGMDCTGTVFSEETQTVTLSRHGAGIISKHKLATDGLLIMRFLGGSTETAIRLVGQLGQNALGFVYGVAFVDEQEDFWELKFPPPQAWNVEVDGPMQCESCKRCEVVDQSEVEADVYSLSGSILRYCIYCGTPTVWRRAPEGIAMPAAKLRQAVEIVAANSAPSRTHALVRKTAELKRTVGGPRPRLAGVELLESETLLRRRCRRSRQRWWPRQRIGGGMFERGLICRRVCGMGSWKRLSSARICQNGDLGFEAASNIQWAPRLRWRCRFIWGRRRRLWALRCGM